jgi:hypothetical protein
MNTYIKMKIGESNVETMSCLHPGCKQTLSEEEIKSLIDIQSFYRYKKFKNRQAYLKNAKLGIIPCAFPDCEQFVQTFSGSNNVTCGLGHSFCAKCKERCHEGDCSFVNELIKIVVN